MAARRDRSVGVAPVARRVVMSVMGVMPVVVVVARFGGGLADPGTQHERGGKQGDRRTRPGESDQRCYTRKKHSKTVLESKRHICDKWNSCSGESAVELTAE